MLPLKGTFAIVDTETTGTSPTYNQIIEIGILRVEDGKLVDTYHTLIKPARALPDIITSITGITNDDLLNAPPFDEVAIPIHDMLKGATLIAHNARFDYSFIKNEFRRLEMRYSAKTLCTVKLSRALFPQYRHHALDDIITRFNIVCEARHRALDDAKVLWDFLCLLGGRIESESLAQAAAEAMGSLQLPEGKSRALVKNLPHAPGVYIFYNKAREVLYVGKSIDIKKRVLSHFSGDHQSSKELRMLSELFDIEHRETTGELSALFLESKLIKELEPVYNRALRKVKLLALMLEVTTPEGYRSVEVDYRADISPEDLPRLLGVFRTVRQAKEFLEDTVRQHAMCPKMMGLENGGGACFAHQLEQCKGACVGRESSSKYNKRFGRLFKKRRIKTWPYPGPVIIKDEVDEYDGVAYVIDNWMLQKTFSYSGDQSTEESAGAPEFDYDSYKILAKFLVENEGRRMIELYKPSSIRVSERTIG